MMSPRASTICPGLLAGVGAWLAYDALAAGSLGRYQIVGCALGAALALPFVSIVLLRDRARRFWRRVLFAAVPLGALLLATELGVRLFGPEPERPGVLLPDTRLGHRNEPFTEGTDARGFRNATALERTDVLFVGDSQTWGFGVGRDATFAALLHQATGQATYQMANGSWGPVQYVELVRQGLALRPRHVVVTVYLGNDLVDAHDYAGLDGAEALRSPGVAYTVRDNPEFHPQRAPNVAMALVDGVLDRSRVLGFAARVVKSRLQGGALDRGPGDLAFDSVPALATILRPSYRMPAVDPTRSGVRDGIAVTERALAAIAAACRTAAPASEPVLVVLPTKEFVYANWATRRQAPIAGLDAILAAERTTHAAVMAAGNAAGMRTIDLAPLLGDALDRGEAPWPASGDGHLNAAGHTLVAKALAAIVRRRQRQ
ncbi:MAG: hypothetical protein JNK15_02570 [Planctomycetes bacterium]|nr:hypothetical protein [Planctomycetota bacterium]